MIINVMVPANPAEPHLHVALGGGQCNICGVRLDRDKHLVFWAA